MSAFQSPLFRADAAMEPPCDHQRGDGHDGEEVGGASLRAVQYDAHHDSHDTEGGYAECDEAERGGRHDGIIARP